MKNSKIILPILAFVFAIASAFATVADRAYYYDTIEEEAVEGDIQQVGTCATDESGVICTVNGEWAFDTDEHAIDNNGEELDTHAFGLLKLPE